MSTSNCVCMCIRIRMHFYTQPGLYIFQVDSCKLAPNLTAKTQTSSHLHFCTCLYSHILIWSAVCLACCCSASSSPESATQHFAPVTALVGTVRHAIQLLCVQNLKQQVKGWEQNSPSYMQVVQHPFSMQVDADTKMPGFDQERQQLGNAMAGQTFCFAPSHSPLI